MMLTDNPFSLVDSGKKGNIVASKKFFERNAVLATANLYIHNCYVSVVPYGESSICVTLEHKDGSPITEDSLREFMNQLIDNQIRLDLQKEFGALRKIIVEHAFSPVKK